MSQLNDVTPTYVIQEISDDTYQIVEQANSSLDLNVEVGNVTQATILSTVLSGLSTATNAVITISDSILTAFGKLQKQINDLSIANTGDETPTRIGTIIGSTATSITSLVDTDQFGVSDSGSSNILKKFSWLNLKINLKSYFDSVVTTLTNKTFTDPTINVSGVTGKVLLSVTQVNLASNYTATAGTGEEEVTGLKVTLPIINRTCTIKIYHKVYVATAPADNSYRIRIGTSLTYTSNTLIDNLYVSGAKTLETMNGAVVATANLATQTYINYSFLNNTNRNGCSISASGARSTVIVEIYA